MPIADRLPEWGTLALVIALSVVFYGGLAWIILKIYRWYRGYAESSLRRAYEGIQLHWPPQKGDVTIRFHTYYGFFVWVTQTEHRAALPPEEARVLLQRLNRYNLSWGFVCPFVVAVPLLSLVHYWGELRSIRRQEREQAL
jgi:hypothetical protein